MADFIWEDFVGFHFSFETNLLHEDALRHDALNHKYATFVYAEDTDMFVKTNGGWVLGKTPMAALRRTIVSKMVSALPGLDSSKREEERIRQLLEDSPFFSHNIDYRQRRVRNTSHLTAAGRFMASSGLRTLDLRVHIDHWKFKRHWNPDSFFEIDLTSRRSDSDETPVHNGIYANGSEGWSLPPCDEDPKLVEPTNETEKLCRNLRALSQKEIEERQQRIRQLMATKGIVTTNEIINVNKPNIVLPESVRPSNLNPEIVRPSVIDNTEASSLPREIAPNDTKDVSFDWWSVLQSTTMEDFDWNNIDRIHFSFDNHSDPKHAKKHISLNRNRATLFTDTDDMFITAEDGTRTLAPDPLTLLRESIVNKIILPRPGASEVSEVDKGHIAALLADSCISFRRSDGRKLRIRNRSALIMAARQVFAEGERTINIKLSISHWHFRENWSPTSFKKVCLDEKYETPSDDEELSQSPANLEDDLRCLRANDETHTDLDLSYNNIGAYGAKALAKALTKNSSLKKLNLESNAIGDDGAKAVAEALTKNSTLKKLVLNSNTIGADGAKALAEGLTKNNTLTNLNLLCNDIGDDGAKALAYALTKNTTLMELFFARNAIGSDGAKALAEALTKNSSLTRLLLPCNAISDDGARALAEAVTKNSSITELFLSESNIGSNGAKALAEALTKNSSLKELNLVNNTIGDDGAKALANALTKNSSLKELYLSDNAIGDDGAKALADVLTKNSTLTKLFLLDNDIGADGAKALADALAKNTTLTTLYLRDNDIGADGAKALADVLTKNSALTRLDLSDNDIGAAGAKALADVLTKNSALTRLDLRDNNIGAAGAKALNDVMTTTKNGLYYDILYDRDKYLSPAEKRRTAALERWGWGKSFFNDLISRHLERSSRIPS